MQGLEATTRHGITRKRRKRLKANIKVVQKEPIDKRCLLTMDLRLIGSQVKRKAFCRHRNPKSSCARKGTVDIEILIKSRNGDKKIIQSHRISGTFHEKKEAEPVLSVQIYLYKRLQLATFLQSSNCSREGAGVEPTFLHTGFCNSYSISKEQLEAPAQT